MLGPDADADADPVERLLFPFPIDGRAKKVSICLFIEKSAPGLICDNSVLEGCRHSVPARVSHPLLERGLAELQVQQCWWYRLSVAGAVLELCVGVVVAEKALCSRSG